MVALIATAPTFTPLGCREAGGGDPKALSSCTPWMSRTAALRTVLGSPGNSCERKFLSSNNKNWAVGGGTNVTGKNQMYGDPGCSQSSHNSSS